MAYILHIESATSNCSVGLSHNGKIVAVKELNTAHYSHAENLHDFIKDVLEEAELQMLQLNAVSISKGPGSYTGLRIGVSAAKGLAFGLQIPLIAVGTLHLLALQLKKPSGLIVPMLDARRMEAYTQIFSADYQSLGEVEAKILDASSFQAELASHQVHFLGSATAKFEEICSHPNAVFHKDLVPSAKEQAEIAFQKFKQQIFEDTAYFEPFYLKDFVAGNKK